MSSKPLGKENDTTYIKDLNFSIQNLLNNVIKSGELDKFWSNVEKTNLIKKFKAKKSELAQKKLEQMSNFDSDENPLGEEPNKSSSESDWSNETTDEEDISGYSREEIHEDPNFGRIIGSIESPGLPS
jgi:hypothetical protein